MKFITTCLAILAFTNTAQAAQTCLHDAELMSSAALILKEGNGKGSGVLYEDDIVLTNHHVIADITQIWVHIPKTNKQVQATVLYSSPKPDIAVLKLNKPVEGVKPLTLARRAIKRENLKLVSFPFGEKHRLGAVQARFNNMARFKSDTRLLYFNALLSDWAFAGDSGGPFFNCKGEIVGLNFGNLALKGTPEHVYAVNMRAIEDALNAASVKVRMGN
ncbi:MAG: S1-C subfamily serine protease [Alphaproteobacteria bacterium]|jgi:S1-C subfamily serine protease